MSDVDVSPEVIHWLSLTLDELEKEGKTPDSVRFGVLNRDVSFVYKTDDGETEVANDE